MNKVWQREGGGQNWSTIAAPCLLNLNVCFICTLFVFVFGRIVGSIIRIRPNSDMPNHLFGTSLIVIFFRIWRVRISVLTLTSDVNLAYAGNKGYSISMHGSVGLLCSRSLRPNLLNRLALLRVDPMTVEVAIH